MMFWGWNWGWGGFWSLLWLVVIAAILIVPWLFFLINLRGLLEKVSPSNRAMPPEQVWLNFIPVFNLGWFIYTVAKVRDSVKAEYYSRGWAVEADSGYNIGLAAGILGICTAILGRLPVIGWAVGVGALICWIIYWLRTADLKHRLSFDDQWGGAGAPPPYADYRSPHGRPPTPGPGGYPPYSPSSEAASHQPRPQARAEATQATSPGEPGQQPPVVRPRSDLQPVAEQPIPAASAAGPAADQSPAGESAGSAGVTPDKRATKQCAVCDTTVAAGDRFCRGCGLPLP